MLAEQAVGGSLIPVPGGVLISTADRHIIGAIGVSGDKFPTADLADESPIATPQSACALVSHATQC